ncbi:MAG: phosphopentomutase [Lachnospiraceae bacterium]|nr:phosphopentomutase [Lachnospiraceae bacterium]
MSRVILIVLDSVGVGELPDADKFGDVGSHTVFAASKGKGFSMPNMQKLGFFNIEGNKTFEPKYGSEAEKEPKGAFGKCNERSMGKDTTTGHWEIAGLVSEKPMPTFPDGFPDELIEKFENAVGRKVLCNKPYSGTKVIEDYGKEHLETGALIVYTSADSVFQVAAHEKVVPLKELYEICEKARELCTGKYAVGRVIARPFKGEIGSFVRTSDRHDFSLTPTKKTMLNYIEEAGQKVVGVGKINDIFNGFGITDFVRTKDNAEGIVRTIEYMKEDFSGLLFTNLVDFDMKYGHRNDIQGYCDALCYFDSKLPEIMENMKDDDILMITADHGCDPSTPSTDHSREYIPWVICGEKVKPGVNLKICDTYADISQTICDYLGVSEVEDGAVNALLSGKSRLSEILK